MVKNDQFGLLLPPVEVTTLVRVVPLFCVMCLDL
jgi:hypothetical protein